MMEELEMEGQAKPKVAVFKLGSCGGCIVQIVNLGEKVLEVLKNFDIAYFPIVKSNNVEGPYDVCLVEGSVSTPEDVARIKEIRKNCKILVALGSCACFGGLQSIGNWARHRELESAAYKEPLAVQSIKALGIDEYVQVDIYLKGCPVAEEELLELLKAFSAGIRPYLRQHSVCVECKLREIPCIMETKKIPCMGPVTCAGCGAICPSMGKPCEGCRGPSNDANLASLIEAFSELGLSRYEILNKLRKYAGEAFREVSELL